MTLTKNLLLSCLITVLFTSCSETESKKKLFDKIVLTEVEQISILKTVKNKETALAAKPKLEKLVPKYEDFNKRLKALKIRQKELIGYLDMDNRLKSSNEFYRAFIDTVRADKEIGMVLQELEGKLSVDMSLLEEDVPINQDN